MAKAKDLTGQKFGKLTAINRLDGKSNGSYLWRCKCDCGSYKDVTARDLTSNRVTSCGCIKGFQRHLEGQRFGSLVVTKDTRTKQKNVKMWLCRCDCGNEIAVRTDSLTGGKMISCGCGKKGVGKIDQLRAGRKLEDHTSKVFFKGTVSKNNSTGINGVSKLKNGKYRASIGYKNKTYSLVEDYDIEITKRAREEADQAIKDGKFDEWIEKIRNRRQKHE